MLRSLVNLTLNLPPDWALSRKERRNLLVLLFTMLMERVRLIPVPWPNKEMLTRRVHLRTRIPRLLKYSLHTNPKAKRSRKSRRSYNLLERSLKTPFRDLLYTP
jgi:hypothetical protein